MLLPVIKKMSIDWMDNHLYLFQSSCLSLCAFEQYLRLPWQVMSVKGPSKCLLYLFESQFMNLCLFKFKRDCSEPHTTQIWLLHWMLSIIYVFFFKLDTFFQHSSTRLKFLGTMPHWKMRHSYLIWIVPETFFVYFVV